MRWQRKVEETEQLLKNKQSFELENLINVEIERLDLKFSEKRLKFL